MPGYIGRPVSDLINRLGFPTRQDTVAGRTVYVWTMGYLVEGTGYACTIRAILDQHNIVTSFDGYGNQGGCADYAAKLGG